MPFDAKATDPDPAAQMEQRYRTAEKFLTHNAASRVANVRPRGRWLGDTRYEFTAEHYDAAADQVIETAMIADAADGTVQPATAAAAPFEPDPAGPALYTPDGKSFCYVDGYDLAVCDRASGAARKLTWDGVEHYAYATSPEAALMAVSARKLPRPISCALWSPDSKWIATHRVDERNVKELGLVQAVPEVGFRPVTHRYRYPMPGDELMWGDLLAIHVETGRTLRVPEKLLVYNWSPFFTHQIWFSEDSSKLYFLIFGRCYRSVALHVLDLVTGSSRLLASESSDSYIDLHPVIVGPPNIRILAGTGEIVWYSERDGWGHLYLLDGSTGAVKTQITRGDWVVRDIAYIDEAARRIYFTATGVEPGVDPYYRQFCAVDLDGKNFRKLVSGDLDHYVAPRAPAGLAMSDPTQSPYGFTGASPDGRYFVLTRSRFDQGATSVIVDRDGKELCKLGEADLTWLELAGWRRPLRFEALAADGVTTLYGALYLPSFFDEKSRYPIIDHIYPGPQINMAAKDFSPSLMPIGMSQGLAELGFAVVTVDGRGTPLRSRDFHLASYGKMHEAGSLEDHVAVLNQLCDRYKFLDRDRIGMTGQSGGGFATARAMFAYPDVYKVGVSVCGNHENRAYTALWFEKYHGPLGQTTDAEQGNATIAHQLKGKLLLIHGDMDENVHVSHTLRVADALVKADQDFDLLIVPNAGHALLMENGHVIRRQWDYFVRHLGGMEPPRDYKIEVAPERVATMQKLFMTRYQ